MSDWVGRIIGIAVLAFAAWLIICGYWIYNGRPWLDRWAWRRLNKKNAPPPPRR